MSNQFNSPPDSVPHVLATTSAPVYTDQQRVALSVDTNGYLRTVSAGGGSAVTIADGSNVVEGSTTDAAVVGDVNGTISAKLRGLSKILNSVWSSVNGWLVVSLGSAIPAGTNLLGQISSSDETSIIYNGTTALTPKFANLTASSSGATTIVALVAAKRIRVIACVLTSNGAVNVKFQSHVTPTDISGLFYEAANTGFTLPYNPKGWFQTIAGEALDINLSAAIAVGGIIQYVEV